MTENTTNNTHKNQRPLSPEASEWLRKLQDKTYLGKVADCLLEAMYGDSGDNLNQVYQSEMNRGK